MTAQLGLPGTVLAYACRHGMITDSQKYPFTFKSVPVGTIDYTVILGRRTALGTVRAAPWLGLGARGRPDSKVTEV